LPSGSGVINQSQLTSMTQKQLLKAVGNRNDELHQAQETLRENVQAFLLTLGTLNRAVFCDDAAADATTKHMIYDILQDRASEIAFGHGIYRH
jgi:hypothetical protein